MAQTKKKARRKSPGRKISGGLYKREKKKRKHTRGHAPRVVKLGDKKQKKLRIEGGNEKTVLLHANEINIIDKKTHKATKAKITNVTETPSNRFLARQNVITKGAIIETDKGKVRITNRPSQEGSVQGILIE
jgi:small subunit ribosomal protein S8e